MPWIAHPVGLQFGVRGLESFHQLFGGPNGRFGLWGSHKYRYGDAGHWAVWAGELVEVKDV